MRSGRVLLIAQSSPTNKLEWLSEVGKARQLPKGRWAGPGGGCPWGQQGRPPTARAHPTTLGPPHHPSLEQGSSGGSPSHRAPPRGQAENRPPAQPGGANGRATGAWSLELLQQGLMAQNGATGRVGEGSQDQAGLLSLSGHPQQLPFLHCWAQKGPAAQWFNYSVAPMGYSRERAAAGTANWKWTQHHIQGWDVQAISDKSQRGEGGPRCLL